MIYNNAWLFDHLYFAYNNHQVSNYCLDGRGIYLHTLVQPRKRRGPAVHIMTLKCIVWHRIAGINFNASLSDAVLCWQLTTCGCSLEAAEIESTLTLEDLPKFLHHLSSKRLEKRNMLASSTNRVGIIIIHYWWPRRGLLHALPRYIHYVSSS